MKSRWVLVSALLVGLALSSLSLVTASAPTMSSDPYWGASALTTEAVMDRARCQIYASDCVFDGGPCGPQNQCHCQFRPSGPDPWICAR